MAINIYLNPVDTKGQLSSSVAPSNDNDLVNKSYVDHSVAVTVGSGKFVLDGSSQATASLQKSGRFIFDLSDSTNASHPFKLSTTKDGTHTDGGTEYTTGVTVEGTQGSAGARLILELTQATPDVLYYYCGSHSGMGGDIYSGIGESITLYDGKVGIGVDSPSRSLDVSGDVKIRGGDILGSHQSLPAVQIDANSNVTIPQGLTVAAGKTVTLNTVEYTFPSSDGSSGQFLSTNASGALSWATASGGGGGGGPTFSTKTVNLTLAMITSAYSNASAKPWYVSDTAFTLSSGDTVVGFKWVLSNTLYKYDTSWQSAPGSAYYDKVLITVDNPDDSTTNPVILSGAAIGQSTWNEGGPYAPSPTGGVYPGFQRQDSSFQNAPVVNYGSTTTDKDYMVFPAHYAASSTVNVRFCFFENTGSSTTAWTINDGTTYPTNDSTVIGTLTMYYRS